jgi:hypothetical protein
LLAQRQIGEQKQAEEQNDKSFPNEAAESLPNGPRKGKQKKPVSVAASGT